MTTLETLLDKETERYVMARLRQMKMDWTWAEFPMYSEVDYVALADGLVRGFLEVKTRKASMGQLQERHPDGVLLKRRKYEACSTLEATFQVPAWVLFGFSDGKGTLAVARPHLLPTRPSILTGRRDRGLLTDEEPVVLINWDELEVWVQ